MYKPTLLLISAFAASACHKANPNVERGKELLAVDEPDAAAREFKIALKQDPGDARAKALLLVAVERQAKDLANWYQLQRTFGLIQDVDRSDLASVEAAKDLHKILVKTRQGLYEKGIDTKDVEELRDLTVEAARFSFATVDKDRDHDERDGAAFVLALRGDGAALAYLVDRLKSDDTRRVPALLRDVGAKVSPLLTTIVADKDNLARPHALTLLSMILEDDAARSWFQGTPELRGIKPADLTTAVAAAAGELPTDEHLTRDLLLTGVDLKRSPQPLTALTAALDDAGARHLLVLQGYAATKKQLVTRTFLLDASNLTELSLTGLRDDGPLTKLSYDAASKEVRLTQVAPGQAMATREVKLTAYPKGTHVRVRAITSDGVVAGVDEFGLLIVELETPRQGSSQMTLTADAVRALETYPVDRVVTRSLISTVGATSLAFREEHPELQCAASVGRAIERAIAEEMKDDTMTPAMKKQAEAMVVTIIPKMKAMMIQRCTEDHWSAAAIKCMGDARTQAEFKRCDTALTKAQKDAVEKGMVEAMDTSGSNKPTAPASSRPGRELPNECETYRLEIERLGQCDALPIAARDALKASYEQAALTWARLPAESMASLGEACAAGADAVRASAAVCY